MRVRPWHILAGLLFALFAFVTGGCTTHDPEDSSVPWGRPAHWEDRPPGMGF